VYQQTRKFALSPWNSFYTHGKIACGISSPHVGVCDKFWPMATIIQAMTTDDPDEIRTCLSLLKKTHAGTHFIHESVHVDDPHKFTRHWFSWANSLFGELITKIAASRPDILTSPV
jgi:meiotically up-regulated gene 157 (Mug157) protein